MTNVSACRLHRTSANLDFAEEPGPAVEGGKASLDLPALSIATVICE